MIKLNDSQIGSSIGLYVYTLENNKFIEYCVLHSFTLCTRSTGAIKNIQFLVVVTTSTSKKLTSHAMLRDKTYKLCCMNNEIIKRKKEKNVVIVPWSKTIIRSIEIEKNQFLKNIVISCLNKSIARGYSSIDHCWW